MPALITDLALILVCAGATTLLFKWLRQPLVLGYIVAGFIAGPHLSLTPSVTDHASVESWAEIGVLFLLFALGLEFSFKKLVKVGSAAVITALTVSSCMIVVGILVGVAFGWSQMDCIFLGGMIAMSSTTIIYKAFSDFGLSGKSFAQLVLSVLILEDMLAIVMMVILSTIAQTHTAAAAAEAGGGFGSEMVWGIAKMVFFLILWFVVGIYLIPAMLRTTRRLMSDETMLVVALGLCFAMVLIANKAGFSSAFGAFIMGSILAETVDAERIEHLVSPVKDLFGAIFFVSVGMMVDPHMIGQYWLPITVLTIVVIVGRATFGTTGVLLAGKPLKMAVHSGMSLTQIGEFSFIIASLGVTLGVTSDFLYPVVVAVSVITTFLTPYNMRAADSVTRLLERKLSPRLLALFNQGSTARTVNEERRWHKLLTAIARISAIYLVVCIAIMLVGINYLTPFVCEWLPSEWGKWASAALVMLFLSPFMRSIIVAKTGSADYRELWAESRSHRVVLVGTIVVRVMVVVQLAMYVLSSILTISYGMIIGLALMIVMLVISSKRIRRSSARIERGFMRNLNARDKRAEARGERKPEYEGRLLSHDLHLADFTLPPTSQWTGHTLMELNLGKKTGTHVVSVLRGDRRHNIPGGSMRLYPGDRLQVIGTDDQITAFSDALNRSATVADKQQPAPTTLRCIELTADSPFLGKTVINCRSREDYRCLIVGIEADGEELHAPSPTERFHEGTILWLVGEEKDIYRLTASPQTPPQ